MRTEHVKSNPEVYQPRYQFSHERERERRLDASVDGYDEGGDRPLPVDQVF